MKILDYTKFTQIILDNKRYAYIIGAHTYPLLGTPYILDGEHYVVTGWLHFARGRLTNYSRCGFVY